MRVLVTVPHCFAPSARKRGHASNQRDPHPRLRALIACLSALHVNFNSPHGIILHQAREAAHANNDEDHEIQIVVCTTGKRHLLDRLPAQISHVFAHRATKAKPQFLGFECHRVLREALGEYDYYCYLEDDIIVHDPWLFRKLDWFNAAAGPSRLLQPNRYETSLTGPVRKAYIDGDLAPHITAELQDITHEPIIQAKVLCEQLIFSRTLNPHAGCFFLSEDQMCRWVEQPHFGVPESSFIGPLESAATLGITRTFAVYKPTPQCASFLEVQHFGTAFISLIGQSVTHPFAQPAMPAPAVHATPVPPPVAPTLLTPTGPHILFVHQNYPAQFGHIARYLTRHHGFRCTFVSKLPPAIDEGVERIQYRPRGGATAATPYCARTFDNNVAHTHAVYEALRSRPDIKPDLIVGHSGFASTLFLRELYDAPIVNYFEWFYATKDSDMDFRPDFPCHRLNRLRARARNATLLLDLHNCNQGYSPTQWQRDRLPAEYRDKVRVIFDGIDTDIWHPQSKTPRSISGRDIPHDMRIVTYVARGFESMRGFDIFMKVARQLCQRRKNVVFVVVGEDRVCYGGDSVVTGDKTFKQWVLAQDDYDLDRFIFTGRVPAAELARLFSLTDLHIYLTVPFILSWSLMDALACGATVLASNTAPVREVIRHGHNGLLADFFDVEGFCQQATAVLDAPGDFAHLGSAGAALIRERYSLAVCLSQMLQLFQDVTV